MAKSSAARIKANNKYNKSHYKQLKINVTPTIFDNFENYCNVCGLSKANFLLSAAAEYMERHPAPKDAVADDLTELSDLLADNSDID